MNAIQRLPDLGQRLWPDAIDRAMFDTRAGVDMAALDGTLQAAGVAARTAAIESQLQHLEQIAGPSGAAGRAPA